VDALLLAGGLGTRLRSVVTDRPKVLVDVDGRPFLAHLLDRLAAQGIERAVLCTGYMADQVQAAFGDEYGGVRLAYSKEERPLGTGGALRHALSVVESEDALVLNGDTLIDVDVADLLAAHRRHDATATLVLSPVEDAIRYGSVAVDPSGRITSFAEKTSGSGWVSAGVYVLRRELIASIPAGGPVSLERDMFPRWIGPTMYAYACDRPFIDIGLPETLARARHSLVGSPT
jgi:D-glycero-alpha-D-manno-heptose 1-phosphate guanylyltransferase